MLRHIFDINLGVIILFLTNRLYKLKKSTLKGSKLFLDVVGVAFFSKNIIYFQQIVYLYTTDLDV